MNKYKYVAYNSDNGEYTSFKTFEEAEKWLIEDRDFSEGISEDTEIGRDFIAKITHRTALQITDRKEFYDNTEEWPYSDEFDYVGEVVLLKGE